MNRIVKLYSQHPILRGMTAYSVLWPSAELCRQLMLQENRNNDIVIDYERLVRFSAFGCFWVAPTVYCWIKIVGKLVPGVTLTSAMIKAALDQVTYGPFSIVTFYYGMSVLEKKTHKAAKEEVKSKLIPTWKAAAGIWPFAQTVNFALIPEKNRVIFTSVISFVWTTYLSFMKARNPDMKT